MARRIVVPGLVSCGLLAVAAFAVTAVLPPAGSSAPPGLMRPAAAQRGEPRPSTGRPSLEQAEPTEHARHARDAGHARPAAHEGATRAPVDLTKTLPPGSTLPSAAVCAAAVTRSSWEPRPRNRRANSRTPPVGWVQPRFEGFARQAQIRIVARVDGDYTGTTDEILQWAACKWGFDVDTVRAQAVTESNWWMSENGDGGTSWGILQIKPSAHPGTWPWARDSTAYNVDYTLARRRACYEGWSYDGPRSRGDLWGCIGTWYSGGYGWGYSDYVASVRHWYRTKPWLRW
jgi:hypothetical protein